MITPGQRRQTEMLRSAMTAIHQSSTGMLPAELAGVDAVCDGVVAFTCDWELREEDPDIRAWYRAALVTKEILRDHSGTVKSEWLAAYAELPPMGW